MWLVTRAVASAATLRSWGASRLEQKSEWPRSTPSRGGDLHEELSGIKAKLFPISDVLSGEFYETKYVVPYSGQIGKMLPRFFRERDGNKKGIQKNGSPFFHGQDVA